MEYLKLLVNEWFKTYEIIRVTKKVFEFSPSIESVGMFSAFKIKDDNDLNFRIKYLNSIGFKEDKN